MRYPISFTLGPAGSVVRDPSFARVAAKAALELDSALLRVQQRNAPQSVEIGAVRTLAHVIKKIADAVRDIGELKAMQEKLDPITANVFLRTYGKVEGESKIEPSKFPAAADKVARVLEHVADQQPGTTEKDLMYARDFCRVLSGQAAGRQLVSHSSAAHGFLRRLSY